MDENEFEFDGVTLEAVDGNGCLFCFFYRGVGSVCRSPIPCGQNSRVDSRVVIFVEKHP